MNRTIKLLLALVVILTAAGAWFLGGRHRPTAQPSTVHSAPAHPSPASASTAAGAVSIDPGPAQASEALRPTPSAHHDADGPVPSTTPSLQPMPSWARTATAVPTAAPPVSTLSPSQAPRGAASWTVADLSNPDSVAAAFAQRYATVDAAVDATPWAGPARAAHLAAPTYAPSLRRATTTAGDDFWHAVKDRRGYTTVTLAHASVADAPPDTATTCYRAYTVTAAAHDDSTWTQEQTRTQIIKLTRTASAWQVTGAQDLDS